MRRLVFLVLAFQILGFKCLWAENKDDSIKVYYLERVVVTAKRTEAKLRNCSASVSFLNRIDLEGSNSNNAVEVLNYLPGVFIEKTGDFGRADIDIRGIGSQGRRIAILVDGRPEKMSLFGCAVTHSLPLSNAEKVELVRGPSSVLYGSDALGGVVNIITRKGKKAESNYTFSYGSFDTYVNRLRLGANLKDLDFSATADKRKSSGHLENSSYDGEEYSLNLGFLPTKKLSGDFDVRYFKGYKEEPLPSPPGTWNDYQRSGASLNLESKFSPDWKGTVDLYSNWGEHTFSDGWHSKDLTYGCELQMNGKLTKSNNLIMGTEWRHLYGKRLSQPEGKWDRDQFSVFFQDEQMLVHRILLSFGERYDHDQISGDNFSTHGGMVLDLRRGTSLRLSVNQGFRYPQINELYLFPISNKELKSEKVWNYEVGINQRLSSQLSFDLTGFVMKGENLIEVGSNLSPPPLFLFQNIGKFDFKGVEGGVRLEADELNGQIYYSHLDPKEKTIGRPEDKLSMKIRFHRSKSSLSLDGQYVWNYFAQDHHQDKIDPFFVLNSKISYDITGHLELFAGVENILNELYQIYVDLPSSSGMYQMPRRSFSVGFRINP
jgi:outer membrane cobalamin receptor